MRLKITPFFALAVFLFPSCKDNIAELPENAVSKFVITANIDGAQTKTTVDYGNLDYASGEKSKWLSGDKVAILFFTPGTGTLVKKVVFEVSTGGHIAELTPVGGGAEIASLLGNYYDVRAVYPAGAEDGTKIFSYNLDNIFSLGDGTSADNISEYDIMLATLNSVLVTSDGADMSFSHKLPMLRFSIKNDAATDIYVDEIRIYSTKYVNSFYESATGYFPGGANNYAIKKESPHFEIVADVEDGEIASGGGIKDFYMMLLENEVSDLTDSFAIMVVYKKGLSPDVHVHEFTIPRSEAYLQAPFAGGFRYLFKLAIPNAENMVPATVNDVEYYYNTVTKNAWMTGVVAGHPYPTLSDTGLGGDPWNVTRIFNAGNAANTSVVQFDIRPSVLCIGDNAFEGYPNLTDIYIRSLTPPLLGRDIFKGINHDITIKIYASAASAFNTVIQNKTMGWGDYTNSPGTMTEGSEIHLYGFCGLDPGCKAMIQADMY